MRAGEIGSRQAHFTLYGLLSKALFYEEFRSSAMSAVCLMLLCRQSDKASL
jgi:hypothetical protein